jgi:glycosyltransferase involved in cell wall biosynthesis
MIEERVKKVLNRRPKVTLLLPIRNGLRWFEGNFPLILENVGPGDELLVIDNGSFDGTNSILKKYEDTHHQMRVITTGPIGLVGALNLGIRESRHEWIARFDIDDRYLKSRIEDQMSYVRSEHAALFADYRVSGSLKTELGFIPSPVVPIATSLSLLNSRRTAHPTVIFRRKLAIEVGGYLEDEFPAEDLGLWFRLSRVGLLGSVPSIVMDYNLHPNSITGKNRQAAITRKFELVEHYFSRTIASQSIDQIEQTFQTYDHTPYSLERKLLHYFDLKHRIALRTVPKLFLQELRKKILYDEGVFNVISALTKLNFSRAARQTYRYVNYKTFP